MKKNFTRQALPAVAMLMVASLSLVGTTYAWFTQNETANVDKVKVQVTDAAGGIAISSSANGSFGTSFDASYTAKDLQPVSNNCVLKTTTLGSGDFEWYKATVDTGDSSKIKSAEKLTFVSSGSGPKAEDYYIAFNIYFENSNSVEKSVYFNYSQVSDMFITDSATNPTINGGDNAELSKAALRIAFINQGYSVTKPTDSTFTPALPNGGTASAIVVEPYDTTHLATVGHANEAVETYGIQGAISAATPINPTGDDVSTYSGSGKVYGAQTTYTVAACNGGVAGSSQALFTLQPGYTMITVVIWLEGQDVDCLNAISGKDLMMNLKFTVNPAQAS